MVSAMTDGSTTITLNEPERQALEGLVANRNTPAKVVWRAKIILATACGLGTMAICKESGKTKKTVWRWQEHYAEEGIATISARRRVNPKHDHCEIDRLQEMRPRALRNMPIPATSGR